MVIPSFSLGRSPKILFGAGTRRELATEMGRFGRRALVVTGHASLRRSPGWKEWQETWKDAGLTVRELAVSGEPEAAWVDAAVKQLAGTGLELVVAIGGGSVLDAGKALSAMLPLNESVLPYLEGAGQGRSHPGTKLPFLAVPTTAGTGTEATKNASLRRLGPEGFKNSLRHEALVPDVALVDPELTLTCPPALTAACGMDALAQLLESYLSPRAFPLTDVLAENGLAAVRDHLLPAFESGQTNLEARTGMAYAALLSGITLANAGLGIIHSLSSVLGGLRDIPHGVICGALLAPGMRRNLDQLRQAGAEALPALRKHATAGALLSGRVVHSWEEGCEALLNQLDAWTRSLEIPRLGAYGLTAEETDAIAAKTPNRNNPVRLEPQDIRDILIQAR
ncbi:MAG: iron-containing alcohol dehydrogenase [candidate division FCPU426 bacterium]